MSLCWMDHPQLLQWQPWGRKRSGSDQGSTRKGQHISTQNLTKKYMNGMEYGTLNVMDQLESAGVVKDEPAIGDQQWLKRKNIMPGTSPTSKM